MYPFLESIKLHDGIFSNLELHQQRISRSLQSMFGKSTSLDLRGVLHSSHVPEIGLYKCRLLYDDSDYRLEFDRYQIKKVNKLKLVVSDGIQYDFKYSNRTQLDELLATREDCDDVLIVKNGLVTDCSYANVAFKKNGRWVTPATPLLKGVMRQRLLQLGVLQEVTIYADDIAQFESCKLINALLELDGPEIEVDRIVS